MSGNSSRNHTPVQVIPTANQLSNNNGEKQQQQQYPDDNQYRITGAEDMYRRSDSSVSGESGPRGRVSPVQRGGGRYGGGDDDYYGRDSRPVGPVSGHGGSNHGGGGRPRDDPYSRGPPPPAGRAAPARNNSGPPQSSETLSMAEQDFLAKYGYSGGRGESSGVPGAHHSMGGPGPGPSGPPSSGPNGDYNNRSGPGGPMDRPRMPRMGGGPPGGDPRGDPRDPRGDPRDPRDRYGPPPPSGDRSVTSHMTESVISQPRMSRMSVEEEMEMQRTQQSRGGGGGRSRSPVRSRYPPPERAPDRVPRPYDRVQNYNSMPNNNYNDRGGGGGYPSRRDPYGDDDRSRDYGDDPRGMDGGPPRRGYMMQRTPSQSTISTSGFRSFYSDAYTIRDRDSVSTGYHNYYDGGPPPPPPRDDYHSSPPHGYGGSGASVGSRGRSPYDRGGYPGSGGSVSGNSRGGGYYGGPPRRGPPPPRDYSPRRQPPPQRGPPPGQPDRPLLEVAPGLMMHLMGTDETMKAIQRGQITVTSCVVCGMDVHCHSASEYVLCPDCRVVSPVNQLDNAADMSPQQGGLVGLGVKTEMLITMLEAGGQQY